MYRACIYYFVKDPTKAEDSVHAGQAHQSHQNTDCIYIYTAGTQIDFVRIVTMMILPRFITNRKILMF